MPQRIVTGQIVRTNRSKTFCFVETLDLDPRRVVTVFAHVSAGRKVTGTTDEPVITAEREQIYPTVIPRNPTKVVMTVRQGDRGWKATTWGLLPERDWRDELAKSGELQSFVGSEVRFQQFYDGLMVSGKLDEVEFDGRKVILVFKDVSYRDEPVSELYVEEIDLNHAERSGNRRGDLTLVVPDGDHERRFEFTQAARLANYAYTGD